jgi:hypothetical protein
MRLSLDKSEVVVDAVDTEHDELIDQVEHRRRVSGSAC